jgi:outer membrane lipoprotein-sorting protein
MILRRRLYWLFAILISPAVMTAQSGQQFGDLLTRIWAGEQQAQAKFTTACGTVTETRTSKLIVKPMVLHGRFCAQGTDRFMLEYTEPNPMRIRFNENFLNLTAGGKTEVLDVGPDVRHAQSSYSGANSLETLKNDFTVTAQENSHDFEMKLVPRTQALHRKLNYLVVKLDKRDFLPRSLEVDSKSGVNSVFTFDITSVGTKLPEDTFEVRKTK